MDFTRLQQHHKDLLSYLEKESYTSSYIRQVQENINWILKHQSGNTWNSYINIYYDRVGNSKSKGYKKNLKIAFSAIQQFDLFGEYPNRKIKNCFIKRGVYHQLVSEFKELIDFYKKEDSLRGIKENTIHRNASGGSSFLYAIQKLGKYQLCDICEKDVLSFFLDEEGVLCKSYGYKKQIATVFKIGMAWKENECRMLLAYLPQIRPKRKNIPYLKPEETDAIHEMLNDETNRLSLRNRAIGKLLYFTGIRASDIAQMTLDAIDWEKEEIRLRQQKTDTLLVLPLTAVLGNAIYDYLIYERSKNNDPHLFLGEVYPHYPLEAGAVWHISALIYKEAAVRQNHGERRGTHLFRHNVATAFLGNGIAHPVISQLLGHTDPASLDAYLHADLIHLKECSLSIEAFPVSEEVFVI
jgi:integrase